MSIKGTRVKTGHPRSWALTCRSGRDRGTLGIKVYEVEVKVTIDGILRHGKKSREIDIEDRHRV